ncbi:MAG TPA: hypothetical protein VLS25_03175 [Dehalococcoidia bacterium]|nr:hypothetical protein [Dehalococcoidia bacterium]
MRPLVGLAICTALILGLAILVVITPGSSGGGTLFHGIPNDRIGVPLSLADSQIAPSVSREQAIATAIWDGVNLPRDSSTAVQEAAVQETLLLVMKETRPVPHDRLVWGVHFKDAVAALGGRYQFMGPNHDVLHEAEFAIVLVDAETGEFVATMEGWNRLQTLPPGLTPPPPLPVSQ